MAVVVVWSLVAGPARAQDPTSLHDDYEQAIGDEAKVRAEYDAAVAKQFQLAGELQQLEAAIAFVQTELDGAQSALDQADAAARATEAQLQATTAELALERQRLKSQAIAAYIGGGASPMPDLAAALKDEDGADALEKSRVYASAVVVHRRDLVERYTQLKAEVEQLEAEAQQHRDEAQAARDEVAARRDDLEGKRQARLASQQQAEQAAADAQRLFGDLESRRRDYELRYAEMATQSDSIREELVARQKGQLPAPSTFGIFLNPIKNGKIVSGYGMRVHPILGVEKMHTGLDLDGDMGAPMRASADGVVVSADERGGYGNVVVIDHGNQLATVYAHMSSFSVKAGDLVTRGEVIGAVGSTGMSTGPHCHWEVRVMGVPVDGTPYLSTAPE